jgi:magnesium chelatase subunit ChlD-like protein
MAPKTLGHRGPGRPAPDPRPRWPNRPTTALARRADSRAGAGLPLHWPRTLAAKGADPLRREHLHHRAGADAPPRCHLVLIDASGSMRRAGRLARAKGCAAWLAAQAARVGEHLGLLVFGGQGVHWLLPPGPARRAQVQRVAALGGGGGTPLARALAEAEARARRHRGPTCLWLLTDGRCAETPRAPRHVHSTVLVDHDDEELPVGRCALWASAWGAQLVRPAT